MSIELNRYEVSFLIGSVVSGGEIVYKQVVYGNFLHASPELLPIYIIASVMVFYGLYGLRCDLLGHRCKYLPVEGRDDAIEAQCVRRICDYTKVLDQEWYQNQNPSPEST